jgi:hypothetical protein
MQTLPNWPRFSLKALFVLVAIVAAYIGGWQHGRMQREMELKEKIRAVDSARSEVIDVAEMLAQERAANLSQIGNRPAE